MSTYHPSYGNLVVELTHGSVLYGLNNSGSDTDIVRVWLPTQESLCLGTAVHEAHVSTGDPATRNSPNDVDTKNFSVQRLLELASRDVMFFHEVVASKPRSENSTSEIWSKIVEAAPQFVTSDVSFSVNEMNIIINRFADVNKKLNDLHGFRRYFESSGKTTEEVYLSLLLEQHHFSDTVKTVVREKDNEKFISIDGKLVGYNASVSRLKTTIQSGIENLNLRTAQLKKYNDGDVTMWRPVCHAIRIAHQKLKLLEKGRLEFPLDNNEYLHALKDGKVPYQVSATNLGGITSVVEVAWRLRDELLIAATNSNRPKTNTFDVSTLILPCYR